MNDHAIVMTCSGNLIVCACAAFNGLEIYGTKADIHIIEFGDIDKQWLSKLPSNFKVIPIQSIYDFKQENKAKHISDHWRAEFYRYKYAASLRGKYKSACIIDADMSVVNDFTPYLKRAEGNKNIILPKNPMGFDIDWVLKNGVDQIQSAVTPSYANMPIFFDPNIHYDLMEKTFIAGTIHPYGDMQMLFRTMINEKVYNNVELTEDGLWVRNVWFDTQIDCRFENKLLCLYEIQKSDKSLKRINSIHQRWALFAHRDQRMKIIRGEIKTGGEVVPEHTSFAHWNISMCWMAIQWLLANGSLFPPDNVKKYLYEL